MFGHLVAQEALELVHWDPGVILLELYLVAQVGLVRHKLLIEVLTEGVFIHEGSVHRQREPKT